MCNNHEIAERGSRCWISPHGFAQSKKYLQLQIIITIAIIQGIRCHRETGNKKEAKVCVTRNWVDSWTKSRWNLYRDFQQRFIVKYLMAVEQGKRKARRWWWRGFPRQIIWVYVQSWHGRHKLVSIVLSSSAAGCVPWIFKSEMLLCTLLAEEQRVIQWVYYASKGKISIPSQVLTVPSRWLEGCGGAEEGKFLVGVLSK